MRRDPLSLFVGLSVSVHVVAAVVLIVAPAARHRAAAAEPSMMVQLAGPMPGPAVVAPSSQPAAPPSHAEPSPPTKEPPRKEVKKSSVVDALDETKRNKKKEPPREVRPLPPASPSPEPPKGPGGSGDPNRPGGGGPIQGGGVGSLGSSELAWYWSSVAAALRGHWVRPVLEGSSDPLSVTITFDVRRDGSVTNVVVEAGSGVPALDRSALRAVADASPLPPIPPSRRELTLSARYLFELKPGE